MTNTRRINLDMLNDPFFIGFDQLFNKLNTPSGQANYPPYNLIKTDEDTYVIELAVAGFSEEDLDITLHDGVLTIKGDVKTKDADSKYLHRGIATRNFTRTFTLANTIEVMGAQVYNGMLQIRLQNIVPDAKKPKKIAIGYQKPNAQLLTE